jgi:hypothetical protein
MNHHKNKIDTNIISSFQFPHTSVKSTSRSIQNSCMWLIQTRPRKSDSKYSISIDVRELISVDDVATEFAMGQNGALVYCMEFLLSKY